MSAPVTIADLNEALPGAITEALFRYALEVELTAVGREGPNKSHTSGGGGRIVAHHALLAAIVRYGDERAAEAADEAISEVLAVAVAAGERAE